jgi:winged helix DNA-binding protein
MPKRSDAPAAAATTPVTWRQVLTMRLNRQQLAQRTTPDRVVDLVRRLVGLHAQVMSSAELQAAARIDGLRAADVRDALWQRRSLVKVWAFRQTLHLLTADDLAEFVVAARSLERWHTPAWLRSFKLTEEEVDEIVVAIGKSLSDRPMTRAELVDAVVARVRMPDVREDMLTGWGTFLAPAAQRGQLVFGPSEGRNVAFVQPSAWLGRRIETAGADLGAADDALARLIARYLAAFPGASAEMIARWWGGGRITAVRRALARMPIPIAEVDVEGTRGLVRREDLEPLATITPHRGVRLVPGFDPFTNELPRRVEAVLGDSHHALVHRTAGWVSPIVILDGGVGGTWEIENGRAGVGTIAVQPFFRLRGDARKQLVSEVDRIAAFLDRPLQLSLGSVA